MCTVAKLHMTHTRRSISSTIPDDPVKNQIARALVERIVRAARAGAPFTVSKIFVGNRSLVTVS